MTQNTMAAKFSNTRQLLRRTLHDNAALREDEEMKNTVEILTAGIEKVYSAKSVEEIIGIEDVCNKSYFSVFKLMSNSEVPFTFELKMQDPPRSSKCCSFVY